MLISKIILNLHGDMIWEEILPLVSSPWYSIGDEDTLSSIGMVLDELDSSGTPELSWAAAQEIAELFRVYACPGGPYAQEADQRGNTEWYLPGTCLAAPIYDGRYDKWGFQIILTAAVGRNVTVDIGNGYRTVTVNFPDPSEVSASEILRGLEAARIPQQFYIIHEADEEVAA